uniref:PUA domain-containing protein n=1 Tax=Phaeomonas parva TaxID=124430 RepID=A0A7S1U6C3_9STRA|mmetsp:Transcript_33720/g.106574  ORF Transcript_33720/g.106574 Transcript_33720/m.106574 type:complete len:184 (+) Transcript_33720:99-650(+)
MFKRFNPEEHVSGHSNVKSSVQRGIKARLVELYPPIESIIEDLLPKKPPLTMGRCSVGAHIQVICKGHVPLFFKDRDNIYPHLKVLQMYPGMIQTVRVDRGAIPFVLDGANIMCPGLTSAGGDLPDGLEEGDIVAVHAEGKKHPLAVGKMLMSSEEIRSSNRGHGIQVLHHLTDGLWYVNHID